MCRQGGDMAYKRLLLLADTYSELGGGIGKYQIGHNGYANITWCKQQSSEGIAFREHTIGQENGA
jgi:hypothetical protein